MPASDIVIRGAREHNLRSVDVILPRNKLICLTGVSGSGKSSLAFDTLYAEGQRRYIESLSSFARQFLGQMPKPDVDAITGLSPTISISQKSSGNNPRSTVGTITEIYDYLRVLFARIGKGHCPTCGEAISAQSREEILARLLSYEEGSLLILLAPLIRRQKGEHKDLFSDLQKQGFARVRVNGEILSLSEEINLERQRRHDIEVVVDRLTIREGIRGRLAEAVDLGTRMGEGNLIVSLQTEEKADVPAAKSKDAKAGDVMLSMHYACANCGVSFEPPTPQLFSFNSPQGMCKQCDGLGHQYTFDPELLIEDSGKSFKQGAVALIDKWKELGRWRRHIYQGVADTMERKLGLDEGTLLETAWEELSAKQQNILLWGTGDEHITFTWRAGSKPSKYGGKFEGIIPELLTKYREAKSKPKRRQLEQYMQTLACGVCEGERLNPQARAVTVTSGNKDVPDPQRSLPAICSLPVDRAFEFFQSLELNPTQEKIAAEVIKEIRTRLEFLLNVGLNYLALDRTAPTLSGGESQRIRLASQIGAGLVGVTYILDEPSIGLHARDNDRLISTLTKLRDLGNTVVVVEHDEDTMRAADQILDFGPGPGVRGGELVATGSVKQVAAEKRSRTGDFLSGRDSIAGPDFVRPATDKKLVVKGARHNNLKNVDIEFPLGTFICITGVSGSGKSSLVTDILVEALRRDLNRGEGTPGEHDTIEGLDHLDKLIAIDQTPIGRTPRSNPSTYIKVFDDIRKLFSQLPESKRRGFDPGRFSFNVAGGRCEACEGNGATKLEMDFLADIWVTCPICQGHRFNRETLQVRYREKNIAEILEMDIQQALELFENLPKIHHKLQTLHDVGLDYLKLGQPSPTLSGGEAQRIKLARELVKKSTGKTLYLLDEPTTGLHFADIKMLLQVLQNFADAGNTVLVVEHNLDVIKTADWIIDLGPEGGAGGGEILFTGTPQDLVNCEKSATGRSLKRHLEMGAAADLPASSGKRKRTAELAKSIVVEGGRQHNLKEVDTEIRRDKMTVFCGPSGSGKSSLAMDTIYAEGQRRYVESLSSYARQFVGQMQKPLVDRIEGLSPAVALEQKNLGHSPRSTVGTVTEIYDYFRILMARLGTPYCPDCNIPISTQTVDQIVDKVLELEEDTRILVLAPLDSKAGDDYNEMLSGLQSQGFVRLRVDGSTHNMADLPALDRRRQYNLEVVTDRAVVKAASRSRLAEAIASAAELGRGVVRIAVVHPDRKEPLWDVKTHSQHLACESCGRSFEQLGPHHFSFNSSLGWCESCEGLGTQRGANPAALLNDSQKSLAEGALALWPDVSQPVSKLMLEALASATGIDIHVPYEQLSSRDRRVLFHGLEESWISVPRPGAEKSAPPLLRFQFKGIYPALEEATRRIPSLRAKLERYTDEVDCTACGGSRLRDDASAVRFQNRTIDVLTRMPLGKLAEEIASWKWTKRDQKIAGEVQREIESRVEFLNNVGLAYLTLARGAATLSGGEAQRIRLASQLGSGLTGVLYVLDEPTIGLHPRDNKKLLAALHRLRDIGNTLLVVEHDREVLEASDYLCDFGPGAGRLGGEILSHGTPKQIRRDKQSITGPFLSDSGSVAVPTNRRIGSANGKNDSRSQSTNGSRKKKAGKTKQNETNNFSPDSIPVDRYEWLEVVGARTHNLRNITARIPLGTLTAVTGVSGSGKSSLIGDILYPALAKKLHRAGAVPGQHKSIKGIKHIDKVIRVDQQALGNTPTSNPATYTGLFELIRQLYAQLPESRSRGYTQRQFSFNVPGGRCEACEGMGQNKIEMHFLPDVWVECEECRGQRYKPETLEVQFHGHSISDILNSSCADALRVFENIPKIRRILSTLCDVGLDYLNLGQAAQTLSGGEAQRVKLASELARPDTGKTLYLLDEPTTGLHFTDLAKLLDVMHRLVDMGNTVVVIEHNLDVIKTADWVIDLGPEAGEGGGMIVVTGTPEDVVSYSKTAGKNKQPRSYTGEMLAAPLAAGPFEERKRFDPATLHAKREDDVEIREIGGTATAPWEEDGRQWHVVDRTDRKGKPVEWEGEILARVVDKIHSLYDFAETNWNSRSVVEITGQNSSKKASWFFHAITAETWLLKLKFRARRNTFKELQLETDFKLKTLNQMEELPAYSNNSRVTVKNMKGPLQEIELQVHTLAEIDTEPFWKFVAKAVASYARYDRGDTSTTGGTSAVAALGERWHFSGSGFPPGSKPEWTKDTLIHLHTAIDSALPKLRVLWSQKDRILYYLPNTSDPILQVYTKNSDAICAVFRDDQAEAFAEQLAGELGSGRTNWSDAKKDLAYCYFTEETDVELFVEFFANFASAEAGAD